MQDVVPAILQSTIAHPRERGLRFNSTMILQVLYTPVKPHVFKGFSETKI